VATAFLRARAAARSPRRRLPLLLTLGLSALLLAATAFTPDPDIGLATTVLGAVGVALGLIVAPSLTADPVPTVRPGAVEERDLVRRRLRSIGSTNRLAWMTTWSQNRWFHGADVHGYLAHRVHAGVAIGLCDPVAVDDADRAALLGEFADRARRNGLVPCVLAASAETAASAVGMGWRILRVGDEAVVDLAALSFQGRAWQDVRTALNHAARRGIAVTFGRLDDQPEDLRRQVAEISQRWTAGRRLPELGFTLGGLVEAADPEVRVAVAVDHDGTVHGVLSWLPSHRPSDGAVMGWTLDVMRRRDDADGFRPVMELLIATSLARFRDEGCTWASLSASPLVRNATPDRSESAPFPAAAMDRALDRALDRLAARLEPYYGFRSLHAFKAKFSPRFEPLYLVYPDDLALPRIGFALARAYLPGVRLRDLAALTRMRTTPPPDEQALHVPGPGHGTRTPQPAAAVTRGSVR
jgi:lysylphosphatidylglycerol synthetase-like protein (DUF2156 family)